MEELNETQARADLQRLLEWIQDHDPSFTGITEDDTEQREFVEYHIQKIKHENGGDWHSLRAERYVLLLTARMRMRYELHDGMAPSVIA